MNDLFKETNVYHPSTRSAIRLINVSVDSFCACLPNSFILNLWSSPFQILSSLLCFRFFPRPETSKAVSIMVILLFFLFFIKAVAGVKVQEKYVVVKIF